MIEAVPEAFSIGALAWMSEEDPRET